MSIGQILATARRDAGLTLADVSRATCIRETIISGIERDDFELCGGHFYARGHIRSVAGAVGVDPRPLVEQYDNEHGGSPQAVSQPIYTGATGMSASGERRSRPNWSVVIAVLLVAVVVFGVFQLFGGSTGSEQAGGTQGQPGPVAEGSRSASPSDSRSAASAGKDRQSSPKHKKGKDGPQGGKHAGDGGGKKASKPLQDKGATIRLVARAPTWISAEGPGGKEFYSGTLKSGDSIRFSDEQVIELQIGNMGGVAMTINGKHFGVVGEPGAVDDLTVYPDRVEGIS